MIKGAKFNLKSDFLMDETIKNYQTEDAVRSWGSGNVVDRCTIISELGRREPHLDMLQSIPTGAEPNAQMSGAVSYDNQYTNNKMETNGDDQCIFLSDGAESNVIIVGNTLDTMGQHYITLCALSGEIGDNRKANGEQCPTVINPMRFGGGHNKSFLVSSFSGQHAYEPINGEGDILDLREEQNDRFTYVEDFDLDLWRGISEVVPYPHGGFNQHFEETLHQYIHGSPSEYHDEYSSETMWIQDGHLFVPNRTKLGSHDMDYWHQRWGRFLPYEVDSRDFSIKLHCNTFDKMMLVRNDFNDQMHLTSAWRSPKHNRDVRGSRRSDHTWVDDRDINGSGFDIAITSISMGRKIEKLAIKHGFNVIGRYPKSMFVHISCRKPKRNGALYQWGSWSNR